MFVCLRLCVYFRLVFLLNCVLSLISVVIFFLDFVVFMSVVIMGEFFDVWYSVCLIVIIFGFVVV